LRDRESRRV
nr:immunoglobulin heavy chain junction region [Homo sapiens]